MLQRTSEHRPEKIRENPRKSEKIRENPRKSEKIRENPLAILLLQLVQRRRHVRLVGRSRQALAVHQIAHRRDADQRVHAAVARADHVRGALRRQHHA